MSPCCRERMEEMFGWIKAQAGLAKVKVLSLRKVEAVFIFAAVARNVVWLTQAPARGENVRSGPGRA